MKQPTKKERIETCKAMIVHKFNARKYLTDRSEIFSQCCQLIINSYGDLFDCNKEFALKNLLHRLLINYYESAERCDDVRILELGLDKAFEYATK